MNLSQTFPVLEYSLNVTQLCTFGVTVQLFIRSTRKVFSWWFNSTVIKMILDGDRYFYQCHTASTG